jgi:L-erythro-3,5-diaminohexanoate dehydrogenase
MLVGNGYVPGHAELALSLVRGVPAVRALFESRLARENQPVAAPAPWTSQEGEPA